MGIPVRHLRWLSTELITESLNRKPLTTMCYFTITIHLSLLSANCRSVSEESRCSNDSETTIPELLMHAIIVFDETIKRLDYARHQLDVPPSAEYSEVIRAALATSEVEARISEIATKPDDGLTP